jgi:peptide/nickel transport system permease protein
VTRRIVLVFPLTFAVVTFVFLVFHLSPGGPARIVAGPNASTEDVERIQARMGLDDPLHVQYGRFLGQLVRGDLGTSLITNQSVGSLILSRMPTTLQLSFCAMLISVVIGVTAGLVSALKRNSIYDHVTLTSAVVGYCIPNFWVALLLIIVFSVKLEWFPSLGKQGFDPRFLILPAVALSTPMIAIIARLTRSGMLEVLSD